MGLRTEIVHFLIIFLVISIQFFVSLGDLGLVGPDEPRYAQISKEMFISKDFITPKLFGQPWLEKPILYYWSTTVAYGIFGVNEFSARVVSAVTAVLGVFCVYLIGRHRGKPREGLMASLVLSTSILYFSLARAATIDMLFCGALTLAWTSLFFILFNQSETKNKILEKRNNPLQIFVLYFSLGLAVLAKGPVGLVLLFISLVLYLGLGNRVNLFLVFRPLIGLVYVLAIVMPWYVLCFYSNGWVFIEEFLIQHNFQRFFTDRYEHTQPFWFYLAVVLIGLFPWSLQLIPAGKKLFVNAFRRSGQEFNQDLYLWSWFLTPVIFFSFSQSKLPGYILPAIPAAALLIANVMEDWLDRRGTSNGKVQLRDVFFCQGLVIITVGVILGWGGINLNGPFMEFIPEIVGILLVLGFTAILLFWFNFRKMLITCYFFVITLSVLWTTQRIYPQVDASQSTRQLAEFLKQDGYTNQPIFVFGISRRIAYGLGYYLNRESKIIYAENEMLFEPGMEAFLITSNNFIPNNFFSKIKVQNKTGFQNQLIFRLVKSNVK